jgi:hypothetical protein
MITINLPKLNNFYCPNAKEGYRRYNANILAYQVEFEPINRLKSKFNKKKRIDESFLRKGQ